MILLNFSHPLTPDQTAQIEALTGQPVAQAIDVPTQFDVQQPFGPQLAALLAGIPLTAQQWQSAPIVLVPPALNFITAVLIAELHGRMGYFAPLARLRPVAGALPPRYEVAELLNLQAIRDAARTSRF